MLMPSKVIFTLVFITKFHKNLLDQTNGWSIPTFYIPQWPTRCVLEALMHVAAKMCCRDWERNKEQGGLIAIYSLGYLSLCLLRCMVATQNHHFAQVSSILPGCCHITVNKSCGLGLKLCFSTSHETKCINSFFNVGNSCLV